MTVRPCPHRNDVACSVCVELAEAKRRIAVLEDRLAPRMFVDADRWDPPLIETEEN